MAIDPEATRYPGTREPRWSRAYKHRFLRRWETPGAREQRPAWARLKRRLRGLFNPRWLP